MNEKVFFYYKIFTFGCQMNKSDSQRISGLLELYSFKPTEDDSLADLIIFNTCSVRQTAEDRIYGYMANIRTLRHKKPNLIVGLTGCMSGRDSDNKIKQRLREVNIFFKTDEMFKLPQWISDLRPDILSKDRLNLISDDYYLDILPKYESASQAYIPISTGCDKYCSYCVVPYARGSQKDRKVADILVEISKLAISGCLEITLLGQTVNLYTPDDLGSFSNNNPFIKNTKNYFAALLWEINQINGIERIHFTAPHPSYVDDYMIEALGLSKMVNFLHLPVQSGDNEILKRMNRSYSSEYYTSIIEKIYSKYPKIALGTDIIVGFCGEGETQFQNTLNLYNKCQFDISYNAMYSVRSGTVAAKCYKDDVLLAEKKRRWRVLQNLMEKIVWQKNQSYQNKIVSVLVDKCENGLCEGNSREMKRVQFKGGSELFGNIVDVKITKPLEWILIGVIKK